MVLPLIRRLPEDLQAEITVLLTVSPSEAKNSFMSREFEKLSRSPL
ncbi:MAG TPA: hypothetical protein VGZ22_06365 [Isosphaeraceae bacterium]|jgi:hypothetical protein|nr:hypothetical protein [Isosphaeraceae bacterium]